MRAHMSMRAHPPVRERADHARPTADLPVQSSESCCWCGSSCGTRRDTCRAGRSSTGRRHLQTLGFHFGGHVFGLLQGGVPGIHGEHGLQGAGRPRHVFAAGLGEAVAHETWIMHFWQRASGSIALIVATNPAHRSPTTRRTLLRPRSTGLRMNRSQLARPPHALRNADDLPVARVVHADGDWDADRLDRSSPDVPVSAPVHERIRV